MEEALELIVVRMEVIDGNRIVEHGREPLQVQNRRVNDPRDDLVGPKQVAVQHAGQAAEERAMEVVERDGRGFHVHDGLERRLAVCHTAAAKVLCRSDEHGETHAPREVPLHEAGEVREHGGSNGEVEVVQDEGEEPIEQRETWRRNLHVRQPHLIQQRKATGDRRQNAEGPNHALSNILV